ncbi:hypothetical protein BFJ68_g9085 [Fusarium oxysporum]|uniref:Uncharacterized protein n=1 Tax=Fusarium oxysporum TaxID=5507 RepID=A0A420QY13_FUSOX|nr:hypothetical protein BFJ71_g1788 [Fusarium oxysporum]RKL09662.1 hypothetical protein BFJ68_g9085 [Fusarium oxysporum]
MRNWGCSFCLTSVVGAFWALGVEAADYRRHDGVHRIEKEAQITQAAGLGRRAEAQCATSMKLCPSSLDGGCCPENYDCAKESCQATTKGPSTCGTKIGWHVCAPVYGGGCCPDGYLCETADNCVPPSGSAYTYDCPASQYLCPSSLSYGCCPNGMACGVNQCYSSDPVTVTSTMVITTTIRGERTTYRTTAVTVETPTAPTALPTVNAGEDNDQAVLKYFPSSIPKVSPTSSSDDDNGDKGGLSTGALAGIIAGSVAFLIIVLVAAFIIIRHLNKVVAAVATPKTSDRSNGSNSQSRQTRQYKTADSAVDELSIDPLIHPSLIPPRPQNPGPDSAATSPFGLASADHSSNEPTPGGNGYHAVPGSGNTSRHASFDAMGNRDDYFSAVAAGEQHRMGHISRLTGSTRNRSSIDSHGTYTHVRNYSNASEGSDGSPGVMAGAHPTAELEATPYVPELPSSPSSVVFPRDERRRSSGSIASVPSRPPVAQRQSGGPRIRSDSLGQSNLSIVNEEMHGFYGPSEHLVGQTDSHRPGTRGSGNRQPNAPMEHPRPVAEEP